MRNIRLKVAYDGTDFHGWQRQPQKPTIQGCLEQAIEGILHTRIVLTGAGRTDAGAHASGQVANFKTSCQIPTGNLQRALNSRLPQVIRVTSVQEAPANFHARYDARSKAYRYRILRAPVCPPFFARFVHHHPLSIDFRLMAQAARLLEGEHDFTSFASAAGESSDLPRTRGSRGQSISDRGLFPDEGPAVDSEDEFAAPAGSKGRQAVRRIFTSRILWRSRPSLLLYDVHGDGFLRYMVRNIVGTLLEVGRGRFAPQEMLSILEARDRAQAGPTAPARGLCLMNVEY